jgi:cytochrome P450
MPAVRNFLPLKGNFFAAYGKLNLSAHCRRSCIRARRKTTMSDSQTKIRQANGPAGAELIATVKRLRNDPLGERMRLFQHYGDVVGLNFGPFNTVMLFHPEHVKHVLQTNANNYGKQTVAMDLARSYAPDGLITSDGAHWARMRKLSQPAFHRDSLDAFTQVVDSEVGAAVARWRIAAQSDEPIDVAPALAQMTLKIVGRALFNVDEFGGNTERFLAAFNRVLDQAPRSSVVKWSARIHGQQTRSAQDEEFWQAVKTLDQIGIDIVRKRAAGAPGQDLLWMLLNSQPDSHPPYSDADLCNQLKNLALAGHETTANALTFCLHLLSLHPGMQQRVRREAALALSQSPVMSLQTMKALPFTEAVFRESMRLYPPAWLMERSTKQTDNIDGWHIPAGTLINLCQFVTHRHPQFWDAAEVFRPERFQVGARNRHPYAAFPFSAGPRSCIGQHMAIAESVLGLAGLLTNFAFEPVAGFQLELEPRIALRSKGGLPLHVRLLSRNETR